MGSTLSKMLHFRIEEAIEFGFEMVEDGYQMDPDPPIFLNLSRNEAVDENEDFVPFGDFDDGEEPPNTLPILDLDFEPQQNLSIQQIIFNNACKNGNVSLVKWFLETYGSNATYYTNAREYGNTSLHLAFCENHSPQ